MCIPGPSTKWLVMQGKASGAPSLGWKVFSSGYVHESGSGRIGYGSIDTFAIKMHNTDWRDLRGALQQVVLNQMTATAVVVSGWSKAEKVSGTPHLAHTSAALMGRT
eukprot:2452062-Ditylum_brightwellii.AAC.1